MKDSPINDAQPPSYETPSQPDKDNPTESIEERIEPTASGGISKLQSPTSGGSEQKAHKKCRYTRDPGMFWVSVGMFFAVSIYAWYARQQAIEIAKTAEAARISADAAKDGVEVTRKQLEISARPWVTFRLLVTGPFEFDDKGTAHLKLRITVKNIGHSIARDINIQAEMFPYSFKQTEFFQPVDRQKKLCEPLRKAAVDEHSPGVTLFPEEEFTQNLGPTISMKEIDSAILPTRQPPGRYIEPMLIGCIDYRYSFAPEHHQTGFIYNIYRINSADPFHGYAIQVNKTLPISGFRLESYFFGGNYAD